MPHCRVYKLREPNRRIFKGKDIDAASDREAMYAAHRGSNCPVCEVWRGARKVGDVE